ncbi:WG repeat-containing protein [Paenibacillus rhizoplanae]
MIIKQNLQMPMLFNEGLAIVYSNAKFDGFINQQGNKVIPKGNYYDAKEFSEGLAAYRTLKNCN